MNKNISRSINLIVFISALFVSLSCSKAPSKELGNKISELSGALSEMKIACELNEDSENIDKLAKSAIVKTDLAISIWPTDLEVDSREMLIQLNEKTRFFLELRARKRQFPHTRFVYEHEDDFSNFKKMAFVVTDSNYWPGEKEISYQINEENFEEFLITVLDKLQPKLISIIQSSEK